MVGVPVMRTLRSVPPVRTMPTVTLWGLPSAQFVPGVPLARFARVPVGLLYLAQHRPILIVLGEGSEKVADASLRSNGYAFAS
jgi:hypothetical protein